MQYGSSERQEEHQKHLGVDALSNIPFCQKNPNYLDILYMDKYTMVMVLHFYQGTSTLAYFETDCIPAKVFCSSLVSIYMDNNIYQDMI